MKRNQGGKRTRIVCDYDMDKNNNNIQNVISPKTVLETAKLKPEGDSLNGGGKHYSRNAGRRNKRHPKEPTLKEVEKFVLETVIGQDEQVKQIVTGVFRAKEFKSIKTNMLIIGQSGSGKTETIKQVASKMNKVYTIEDATKYTQEGYYGGDVSDMLQNLYSNANGDLYAAEHGMLIIDEIDKKAGGKGIDNDVSGVEVLKSLLKIIEGTKIEIPNPFYDYNDESTPYVQFDTSKLIVIFMGAFEGLKNIREKRLKTGTSIGFATSNNEDKSDKRTIFTKDDLINYGIPEEFVGRIDTIVEMNVLTKNDLIQILGKSKGSIFKKYTNEFQKRGVKLEYGNDLFSAIAEKSFNLNTGARELSNTVNQIFSNITYDVLVEPNKYRNYNCVLDTNIVYDNTKYMWKCMKEN